MTALITRDELRAAIQRWIPSLPPASPPPEVPQAEHRVYRPAAERSYEVQRVGERTFAVTGKPQGPSRNV